MSEDLDGTVPMCWDDHAAVPMWRSLVAVFCTQIHDSVEEVSHEEVNRRVVASWYRSTCKEEVGRQTLRESANQLCLSPAGIFENSGAVDKMVPLSAITAHPLSVSPHSASLPVSSMPLSLWRWPLSPHLIAVIRNPAPCKFWIEFDSSFAHKSMPLWLKSLVSGAVKRLLA